MAAHYWSTLLAGQIFTDDFEVNLASATTKILKLGADSNRAYLDPKMYVEYWPYGLVSKVLGHLVDILLVSGYVKACLLNPLMVEIRIIRTKRSRCRRRLWTVLYY